MQNSNKKEQVSTRGNFKRVTYKCICIKLSLSEEILKCNIFFSFSLRHWAGVRTSNITKLATKLSIE